MDYDEDPEPPNYQADEWREYALRLKAERDEARANAQRDNEAMTAGRNALIMWHALHREGYRVRPTELEQSQAALKKLDEALGIK
jgi:hypothetical protein